VAARRGQLQIEALLDAVVAISSDLELSEMLRRIVEAACSLTNAKYGALGVLGPDRTQLVEFITHGLTEEERQSIDDLPRGRGVLGLLIKEPYSLRISDLSHHSESVGFPPNHPPMSSFLGAPIRLRDEVFGNLYLTEKQDETEFSAEDESMLNTLAAAAGVALQNARLYEDSTAQRERAVAITEVTQSLLTNTNEATALQLLAVQICGMVGSIACVVALHREGSSPLVSAVHSQGSASTESSGALGDEWRTALSALRTLLLIPDGDETAPPPIVEDARRIVGLPQPGPTALVPITANQGVLGYLIVIWAPHQGEVASRKLDSLEEFAQQVAIALIASRAEQNRSKVVLLEDRERIARDMHDIVIQRLFATGLSLQFAGSLTDHPTVRDRLGEAVTELDKTIAEVRGVIYQLHTVAQPADLTQKVSDLIQGYSQSLGFPVQLHTSGSHAIHPDIAMDVLAVIREGLANAVRHSRASSVAVTLSLGRVVRVQIDDDGVGLGEVTRRSGLANLVDRAKARSGHCEITHRQPSGTRIDWSVPAERSVEGAPTESTNFPT